LARVWQGGCLKHRPVLPGCML